MSKKKEKKNKEKMVNRLEGITSINMLIEAYKLITENGKGSLRLPYFKGKKMKMSSIKIRRKNINDFVVHVIPSEFDNGSTYVLVNADGVALKYDKNQKCEPDIVSTPCKSILCRKKKGRPTAAGYTIPMSELISSIEAYSNHTKPTHEPIYAVKNVHTGYISWIWDKGYKILIELPNGMIVAAVR